MNRMTEFTFSLADSLLKLFFIMFQVGTKSEENAQLETETLSEEIDHPETETVPKEITQPEKEIVADEVTHVKKETAHRSLVKQNAFSEEYRTTEIVTGIIGIILGVLTISLALIIEAIGVTFKFNGTLFGEIMNVATPIFVVLAITGVIFQGKYPKLGGWLIIIAAVEGFVAMPFLYLPSGMLLLISGYMGVQRSNQIQSCRGSSEKMYDVSEG